MIKKSSKGLEMVLLMGCRNKGETAIVKAIFENLENTFKERIEFLDACYELYSYKKDRDAQQRKNELKHIYKTIFGEEWRDE